MALAKDQTNSSSFYGNMLEHGSSIQFPYIDPYVLDEYIQKHDHQDDLDSPRSYKITSNINHIMNLSGGNSGFQPHEEVHSLLTFKSGVENIVHNSETSLLSFHQGEHRHYQLWQGCSSISSSNNSTNLSVMDEASCLQTTSKNYRDEANEWLFHETTLVDPTLECGTQRTSSFNKRPQMEENMHGLKKQCIISPSKKIAKPKSSTSKDPQSIAAKNRRERISERLKILQDLVPNGSKVDLVTMLEKAINYVKFLQLQVKVLAADEFWPEAGGKAPDISQVREAIDAILTSQRTDRSSTSSNS